MTKPHRASAWRFTHVALRNWRNFTNIAVTLPQRVFLVGPNASGASQIPGAVYGRHGKAYLRQHITRDNAAAQHSAWAVLIDLDNDAACAPTLQEEWLASPAPRMCLRIAVRAVETWLLAGRQHFAQFLSIPVSRIPPVLEAVDDPKLLLVNLVRHSRKRAMRVCVLLSHPLCPTIGSP